MPATRARRGRTRKAQGRLHFEHRLVLNQWMLGLFGVRTLNELAGDTLKDPAYEGFDDQNVSRFHHVLAARQIPAQEITPQLLLEYDENIVRHWRRIIQGHDLVAGRSLYPKYFQYLALLFTEIYLDRYFRDPEALRKTLNAHVAAFNADQVEPDRVHPYKPEDLNKLAFWSATGSGKTFLMHVNLLQYLHYMDKHGRRKALNRIILLTPNEGLSQQHLEEFERSGIQADIFSKAARTLFAGYAVEIIDLPKLREETGEKTVAVDAFERNNLVLVDEGHRGSSGEEWKDKRDRLCEDGFAFEYSATFGQAMKAARKPALTQEYARAILFDYSYRYFFDDGYGKDYHILNLKEDGSGASSATSERRRLYLAACLLTFYQQLRLFHDRRAAFAPYLVEKPLWVFVGSRVTQSLSKQDATDIEDILLGLTDFADRKDAAVARIQRLLDGRAGLLDPQGREIFANAFTYLSEFGLTAEEVYLDALRLVFNAQAPGKLHVEHRRGNQEELALSLGMAEPFGVVNVGDAAGLRKLCEKRAELVVEETEIADSLFRRINTSNSTVKLLVGSKKFTEGWNSWRVSTMGLLNVGKNEGSMIIQLFGRGVRLKGYDYRLTRSSHVQGITPPPHLRILETLNVFGVRADYMQQFREYLEEEGVQEKEYQEIVLPVVPLDNLAQKRLRLPQVKEGINFKRDGRAQLGSPPDWLKRNPIVVDWYPKLQARHSAPVAGGAAVRHEDTFRPAHLAFLDLDALYFELVRYKNARQYYNMHVSREAIHSLLNTPDWYRLVVPAENMELGSFERVRLWQELAMALLKQYCDRFYAHSKTEFELPHMEYRELALDGPNFPSEYLVSVEASQAALIRRLGELKNLITAGKLKDFKLGPNADALVFNRHLYQPLLYAAGGDVQVKPVALNKGERDFVQDLKKVYEVATYLKGMELYLLRNQSRRGVGFFEAENFYPDFILWVVRGKKQRVAFVDPKGIRNLRGIDDPKIAFSKTIKDLEHRLADPDMVLQSFIISVTPLQQVTWWDSKMTEADFEQHNVLFQQPGETSYVDLLLRKLLADPLLA